MCILINVIFFLFLVNSALNGQLYISEISEGGNYDYTTEYMEIYNAGNDSVSLTGYKIIRVSAATNEKEYVFDIGSDGAGGDEVIPAQGLWIVSRCADRPAFEAAFSSFPAAARFYDGSNVLYFAAATARRWRLRANDGTVNSDDGTLVDDTGMAAAGEDQRTVQNPIGTFTTAASENGSASNPGFLDGDQSLPVRLTDFNVHSRDGVAVLTWTTESEVENLGFLIYRKFAGGPGRIIADYRSFPELAGHGSVSYGNSYRFTDSDVMPGEVYYYRLADIDFSGQQTNHHWVPVMIGEDVISLRPVWPNPANQGIMIQFSVGQPSFIAINIYDITGRLIINLVNQEFGPGVHMLDWNGLNTAGQSAASGTYLLLLTKDQYNCSDKITLVR